MLGTPKDYPWVRFADFPFLIMVVGVSFIIEVSLGLVLKIFLSIPLIGGLLSAPLDAIIIFLGIYLVPRRLAAFWFATILLTLETVTPGFGPPGLYKILIGLALGLLAELILELLGRRHTSSYVVATAVAFSLSIPFTYVAWRLFSLPGVEELWPLIGILMAAYFIEGLVGALIGAWIYKTRLAKNERISRYRTAM